MGGNMLITKDKMQWKIGRVCEICGWGTNSLDKHLCEECRIRLRKMLYPRGKVNDEQQENDLS